MIENMLGIAATAIQIKNSSHCSLIARHNSAVVLLKRISRDYSFLYYDEFVQEDKKKKALHADESKSKELNE